MMGKLATQQIVLELEKYQQRLRELKVIAGTEGLAYWLTRAALDIDAAIDHIVAADMMRRASAERRAEFA